MAGNAALIISSAVAAVATGRVKFSFDLVHGDEVAPVLELPVGTVAVDDRRFHLHLVGVTVGTEGAFVAGRAEPVVRSGVETVALDE